mgnify:CR=1 FL=1
MSVCVRTFTESKEGYLGCDKRTFSIGPGSVPNESKRVRRGDDDNEVVVDLVVMLDARLSHRTYSLLCSCVCVCVRMERGSKW